MDVNDSSLSLRLRPSMEIDYDDWNTPLLDCRCILSMLEDISDPLKSWGHQLIDGVMDQLLIRITKGI